MPTKPRTLSARAATTALQAHARAQCTHEFHDMVRHTTCACGHEEREVIPRDDPDGDMVYTPEMVGDLVRLALKGFLDLRIEDGRMALRMPGETLADMLQNSLNRVSARRAGGVWREVGDTLYVADRP